jgi:hypothetical protein
MCAPLPYPQRGLSKAVHWEFRYFQGNSGHFGSGTKCGCEVTHGVLSTQRKCLISYTVKEQSTARRLGYCQATTAFTHRARDE